MQKFLPTKDFHVLQITGLSVKDIKTSVKTCKKDRKVFKQSTALNVIAKQFGIREGFPNYAHWYDNELLPFMKSNGLEQYKNLTQNTINEEDAFFTHKEIADRLYFSKKPTPKKIFTGYNFQSKFIIEEIAADFLFYNLLLKIYREDPKFNNSTTEELREDAIKTLLFEKNSYFHIIHQYIYSRILLDNKNLIYDTFIDNKETKKDTFSKNIDNRTIIDIVKEDFNNLQHYDETFGENLQKQLKDYKDGWVEVIPFYDLYFLKASNGDYDFVFKNLKNKEFQTSHTFFAPYLQHADIPSTFKKSYDFERWLYFGHKNKGKNPKNIQTLELWEERDLYLAQKKYPNADNPLVPYYTYQELYNYNSNGNKNKPEFLQTVSINENNLLHISNVITIKQFEEFISANPEYIKNRHNNLDKLKPINNEKDKSLPVTITWFDALAYCKWIENEHNIPARLLKLEEYQTIHPYPDGCYNYKDYSKIQHSYDKKLVRHGKLTGRTFLNDVRFIDIPQLNSPDYRSDFNDLTFSYIKKLTYIKSKDNISFCISSNFGEWLFNHTEESASAILPYFMQSLYGDRNFYFDPKSSGKRKYRKIGFRICYETKYETKKDA